VLFEVPSRQTRSLGEDPGRRCEFLPGSLCGLAFDYEVDFADELPVLRGAEFVETASFLDCYSNCHVFG
jgi:hypothetical protein